MKTSKALPPDFSSSRRAQPPRQTRTNPPRASISSARPFASRGSVSGGLEDNTIEIFPAITHFADAITALPKELVRHFTLLKEVDAKIFAPEEDLARMVEHALSVPLHQRPQPAQTHNLLGPTSAPMSAQGSFNGSVINGVGTSVISGQEIDLYNPAGSAYDQANMPRRHFFQQCAYTMSNMLVSLDEKNHVISTAAEALNKQLARIDDVFPFIQHEVSEEAKYGSTTHWAYPENRLPKSGGVSRREIAAANSLSAAAQHLADEAAARSDARKQALLEKKKSRNQHIESDFDDHHDGRHKEKKLHGNSKVRKAADASQNAGLGITNGAGTNGNPPKRRKVNGPTGGTVMDRSMGSVFGSNGTASKVKGSSPRGTPAPDGAKKRSRAALTTNGQPRKRNNTVTSALSPSIASSPVRNTFPEPKISGRGSPTPANGRPVSSRARQNSTQSTVEKRPPSETSNRQNGNTAGPTDLGLAATVTGKIIPEVKVSMKESAANSKGEHTVEAIAQEAPEVVGGVVVSSRKDSVAKREDQDGNGDLMQGIQITTVVTKSGRASKPSTPALSSFPEPIRSRSQRNALEATSNHNKRSHKKGAGAAAQLLAQQQTSEADETGSNMQDDDEDGDVDADEPTYCFCNGVSYGEMVGCDADGCEREWFHLDCVGLKVAPKGNAKWYCDDCKEKMKTRRFNGR